MKNRINRIIGIALVIAMVFGFAVPATASEPELSVFVASDIHYKPYESLTPIAQVNNLPGDTLYSHANTKSMLTYEAYPIIQKFLDDFEQSDAQYLLIPGDLSEDGFWDEHLGIAQILRDFMARTGKQVFVIPGNHDIRTSGSRDRLNLSDFLDVYADIGYDKALARHLGSASYTADLDDNYRLLALDACVYREDGGRVSDELLAWIELQVEAANNDGKKLIGMVHHSVLEHFAIESIGGELLCLENYRELATQFADWGIKYFFTGHGHANDISSAQSENGNTIFDIETGSLITYPNAYRHVSFSESAVEVETRYVTEIDTSLLAGDFSAEQIDLLENDFPTYSYDYFRAGFKSYAYQIPGLTAELAKDLEVEEGTAEYDAIDDLMEMLCYAASLPLYDEAGTPEADSIEEIAINQGFEIEPSEYDCVLDVAAVIYAGHYAGDEAFEGSVEVELLSQGLYCVLMYAFTNLPTTTTNTLLGVFGLPALGVTVIDDYYTAPQKQILIEAAVNVIMEQFMQPVAGGIINDISEPADLNVTLEPYGESSELTGNTIEISELGNFLNILTKFLNSFVMPIINMFAPQLFE